MQNQMIMEDREDGEVSGSDDESNVYNPILRPDSSQYRLASKTIPSSDENSNSDSDEDLMSLPKRKRTQYHPKMDVERNGNHESAFKNLAQKKKKNNIWANVIQEEELTQEIGSVGLKKLKGDRNVESYDYTQALKLYDRPLPDSDEEEEEEKETEEMIERRLNRKRRFGDCLDETKKKEKSSNQKPRTLVDIPLDLECSEEDLGTRMATALFEQKSELIVKVVKTIGKELSFKLYAKTQKVELEGGMMILNGYRRRTSGGVFLQLLKNFDGVEKNHLSQIFSDDKESQQWRKRKRMNRKRENHDSKPQNRKPLADTLEEEEETHLPGIFSEDPGGTKCPGSTPVSTPRESDIEEEGSYSPHTKCNETTDRTVPFPLREVCEKAALEISHRDCVSPPQSEPLDLHVNQDEMDVV